MTDKQKQLSDDEKKALAKQILERLDNKKKLKKTLESKGNKEPKEKIFQEIKQAASAGDEELRKLASLLAFESVKNYYNNKKAPAYVENGRTSKEDLQSELFLVILENIEKYNGENGLFAFFEPYVRNSFMKARERGRGIQMTKYYQDMGVLIVKAKKEISKYGLYNPTPIDIADYIKVKMNRPVSPYAVESWLNVHSHEKSIDDMIHTLEERNDSYQPEKTTIKREEQRIFYEKINQLTPVSRKLILLEVEYTEEYGIVPSFDDISSDILLMFPELTKQMAEARLTDAHNELKAIVKGTKRKLKRLPLNHMMKSEDLKEVSEELFMDIETAMEKDMDSILPPEDE